ncbi:MAG: riboflavin synthase [Rickettsiales bacterium]|nr:riboflavin synthase [Rickettsiales bacterium]
MFTGIIENFAVIKEITKKDGGDLLLVIASPKDNIKRNLDIGCSIACNGICLTLVKKSEDEQNFLLSFEASNETCQKTTIKHWVVGQEINIEFALRVGDELGGHMVLGHVDGIATISNITKDNDSHIIKIDVDNDMMKFIAKKGSVTIDGVSLTVNEIKENSFYLNIISHTMQNTIFKHYNIEDQVNLEIDVVARYINK